MPLTTFAGHPLHPQLITMPAGLLPFSLVLDLLHLKTGRRSYADAAYYTMIGGLAGGVAAGAAGGGRLSHHSPRKQGQRGRRDSCRPQYRLAGPHRSESRAAQPRPKILELAASFVPSGDSRPLCIGLVRRASGL